MPTPDLSSPVRPASTASTPLPPRELKIKRRRDEDPVPSLYMPGKRAKLSVDSPTAASTPSGYVFRLRPATAPSTPPRQLAAPRPIRPPTVLTTSANAAFPRLTSSPSKRKLAPDSPIDDAAPPDRPASAPGPIKRFRMAKPLPHPYAGAAKARRMAVFERVRDEITGQSAPATPPVEVRVPAETPRRKPPKSKISTKEKEEIAARKRKEEKEKKAVQQTYGLEDDAITQQMQEMVLEYLNVRAKENASPPPAPLAPASAGGAAEKAVRKPEDDDGDFVYDVYLRDEAAHPEPPKEAYGVLSFADSDDEDWWFEGGESDGEGSEPWRSDDEDSNAEDFHTNDYPDEPGFAGEEDEDEGYVARYGHAGYEEGYDGSDDDGKDVFGGGWRRGRTIPGEEEYDLDDEFEEEEEARKRVMERMRRGIWGLGGKQKVLDSDDENKEEDSDDEMET